MEYEPNREFLHGNCGVGQLTTRGYAQQLNNGAALAKVSGGTLVSHHMAWSPQEAAWSPRRTTSSTATGFA